MNDEEMISKKDLLELTNISYGQLYRWKRKGLIPEDWFIKKSSFTGQETFFPKEKVLVRIEKIINMKDDISLNDIADVFSPTLEQAAFNLDEILKRNIVTQNVFDLYLDFKGSPAPLEFDDALSVFILNKFIVSGSISLDEGRLMLGVLKEGLAQFNGLPSELMIMRKLGVFSCMLVSPPCRVCADNGVRLIEKVNIPAVIEELKLKLM